MKFLKLGLLSLLAMLAVSVFLTSCEQEEIKETFITDYQEAEERLGDFIIEEGDAFVLTETDPEVLGIAPEILDELIEGFNAMNDLVRKGEVLKEQINTTVQLEEGAIESRDCGRNKVDLHWTSFTLYLSNDKNNLFERAQCYAVGRIHHLAGLACSLMYWNAHRDNRGCPCGYKYNYSYSGQFKSVKCQ